MRAYMRDQFPFLGLPTPARAALDRAVLAGVTVVEEADLAAISLACWDLREREYQYFACDVLRRHAARCGPAFIGTTRVLITTKSWWDTVDVLAQHVAGSLVARNPSLVPVMEEWIDSDDIWLARTAILHQNRFKSATDPERLFRFCLRRAADKEFFIRKAIGWALREYSKTDAAAVRAFVDEHADELSGLSRTEALKWLARRAAT